MHKDGKPVEFTMLVYSGNAPLKTDSQIIQASLQQIGIKCDINVLDFSAELPQLNSGDFECDIMRWTSLSPNILSLIFKTPGWRKQMHDSQLAALCTTRRGTPPSGWMPSMPLSNSYSIKRSLRQLSPTGLFGPFTST